MESSPLSTRRGSKMSDIREKLKHVGEYIEGQYPDECECIFDAVDEIDRLTAELATVKVDLATAKADKAEISWLYRERRKWD